ncbi:DUF3039 domain-containing protein [Brevibacterium oceani]|uniref:DUF3039 domain-containing protein n=1 Tax=Brevibacterium oceani TaxID=358099 RepID=UPI0015E76177|nr:DUF3039 domain-containing protein [Brevibacterium oceani]
MTSDAPVIDRPDADTSVDDAFRELTGFEEQLDDGSDKERFSHYASKDDIVRAAVEGVAIVALCGKKWRPQRDPSRFPVCPTCREVFEQMKPGDEG